MAQLLNRMQLQYCDQSDLIHVSLAGQAPDTNKKPFMQMLGGVSEEKM